MQSYDDLIYGIAAAKALQAEFAADWIERRAFKAKKNLGEKARKEKRKEKNGNNKRNLLITRTLDLFD